MKCQEKQRLLDEAFATSSLKTQRKGRWMESTSQCLEPIRDLSFSQYQVGQNKRDQRRVGPWPEWRPWDGNTLRCVQRDLLKWIGEHDGNPRPEHAKVIVDPNFDDLTFPGGAEAAGARLKALEVAEAHAVALNIQPGVWQRPWPDFGSGELCPPELYLMRSPGWMEALWKWPECHTLSGRIKRDLERLADLMGALDEALQNSENDLSVIA